PRRRRDLVHPRRTAPSALSLCDRRLSLPANFRRAGSRRRRYRCGLGRRNRARPLSTDTNRHQGYSQGVFFSAESTLACPPRYHGPFEIPLWPLEFVRPSVHPPFPIVPSSESPPMEPVAVIGSCELIRPNEVLALMR